MQIIKEGDINGWLFLVNDNARICIKSCVTLFFKNSLTGIIPEDRKCYPSRC